MGLFAPRSATVRPMRKTKHSQLQPILDDVAQSPERSTLFWWLSENHDALIAAAAGRRIQWLPHIPRLLALDLRDGKGKPVTPRTASDTWAEVKRDVARTRTAKAGQVRKLQPSHLPATWRPTPEAAPTPPTFSRPVIPQPSQPVRDGEARPLTAAEKVAAMRQELARKNGR